jgi:hypothetical protein
MKTKTDPYREWLKQDLGGLVDALDLSDLQKHFLRSRWLDQVLWMEGRADNARKLYYGLRLTAIIGGVIVPALVSLNLEGASAFVRLVTIVLSIVVAVSVAVEEFFHYGERWRHYRRTVECLKIEGWKFFQLSGPYGRSGGHNELYADFAERVEEILKRDVDVYVTELVREKEGGRSRERTSTPGSSQVL